MHFSVSNWGEEASKMQKTMQDDAAVFRTQETLAEGCEKIDKCVADFDDVEVTDKSLVWNFKVLAILPHARSLAQSLTYSCIHSLAR